MTSGYISKDRGFLECVGGHDLAIDFGEATLDGSGATVVTTKLRTILGVLFLGVKVGTAPGVSTSVLTHTYSGGALSIWPWKVTGTDDATLVASDGVDVVSWSVIGRK